MLQDRGDGEEQVALPFIVEAVLFPEAVFLRHPGEAEGLTRESAAEDVEGGGCRRRGSR